MVSEFVDFRRCRGFVGPLLLIVAMLELVNWLTIMVYGSGQPGYLPLKYTESAESKARNLERLFPPSLEHTGQFLLYLGASSAGEAIEAPRLAARDAYGGPVCGICGIFAGFDILQRLADPLIQRNVRPKIVLLCIHTGYLAVDPSGKSNPPHSISGFVESALTLQNIKRSRAEVGDSICRVSSQIRHFLGIPEPNQSPWTPPNRMGNRVGTAKYWSSIAIEKQFSTLSASGAFDSETYVRFQDHNVELLIQLIGHFNRLGSETKIVLMPEHSAVYNRIPFTAYEYLVARLSGDLGNDAPEVWNFVKSVPDDLFADYIHVNDDGRLLFSKILAEKLHDYQVRNP